MKKIILTLILIAFLALNILFLINNDLDERYLIDPFEQGDNILDLKKIAIQKLEDAKTITLINLGLFTSFIFVNFFYKKKI